jgi:hypothetical protein
MVAYRSISFGWLLYTDPGLVPIKSMVFAAFLIPFQIMLACGLLRRWRWCWILTIILFARKALGMFLALFQGEELAINLILTVCLSIEIIIVWYLINNKAVRTYFAKKQTNPSRDRDSPHGEPLPHHRIYGSQ